MPSDSRNPRVASANSSPAAAGRGAIRVALQPAPESGVRVQAQMNLLKGDQQTQQQHADGQKRPFQQRQPTSTLSGQIARQ